MKHRWFTKPTDETCATRFLPGKLAYTSLVRSAFVFAAT